MLERTGGATWMLLISEAGIVNGVERTELHPRIFAESRSELLAVRVGML